MANFFIDFFAQPSTCYLFLLGLSGSDKEEELDRKSRVLLFVASVRSIKDTMLTDV